ncbi:MAG: ATP-binding protein [Reichenbachiella sp.]
MFFKSLTKKLLSIVVIAFTISIIAILILSHYQLTNIIDESQQEMYGDKIDVIWETLDRVNTRLEKTGLVEAYEESFKFAAVAELQKAYYKDVQNIYPIIITSEFDIVLHPVLAYGDTIIRKAYPKEVLQFTHSEGDFNFAYLGENKWYSFRKYKKWNWIILYAVPIETKYSVVREFSTNLTAIMVSISLLVLIILGLVIIKAIKPIHDLTIISSAIAQGNLDQPIVVGSDDEVGVLTNSFEKMRQSIKHKVTDLEKEIIERKIAESELKNTRDYITNIVDSMSSVVIGVDTNGSVTQWNKKAEESTGVGLVDAIGNNVFELIPRLTIEMEHIQRAIETGQAYEVYKKMQQNQSTTWYEDIIIFPLTTETKKGAVIRIDDVSHKVKIEEMLVQSEKMHSVGGLAAGMAHEINNPLGGVMQTASVLQDRLNVTANIAANKKAADKVGLDLNILARYMEERQIPKMIKTIIDSGNRASIIVSNMLNFSRKTDDSLSTHSIPELIEATINLANTDFDIKKMYDFKSINIHKNYSPGLPSIVCDFGKIQQVFLNILTNGAQAMLENKEEPPEFTITTMYYEKENMVSILITDNGPGMSPEVCQHIFEPFYTTKKVGEGTGLGLSVSYFIITEHLGGQISVSSQLGEGTTFNITIPVA